eukprot:TRINITY_DN15166_c0_g1_i1.p1 TRINITY_DN15166_c0_g1~~TRINITY_DN15166_c0_g1_i1.p1  ORF type:complete len:193 (+),score=23.61 TRINITY_DN15166_c0_g1_i1:58-636(+)
MGACQCVEAKLGRTQDGSTIAASTETPPLHAHSLLTSKPPISNNQKLTLPIARRVQQEFSTHKVAVEQASESAFIIDSSAGRTPFAVGSTSFPKGPCSEPSEQWTCTKVVARKAGSVKGTRSSQRTEQEQDLQSHAMSTLLSRQLNWLDTADAATGNFSWSDDKRRPQYHTSVVSQGSTRLPSRSSSPAATR